MSTLHLLRPAPGEHVDPPLRLVAVGRAGPRWSEPATRAWSSCCHAALVLWTRYVETWAADGTHTAEERDRLHVCSACRQRVERTVVR